jgi:hypothetical protein
VLNVPEGALSPNSPFRDDLADKEEAEFNVDKETPPDKDTKLFNVADNLIKSQLSRIDVPLMGALSFDQSDTESEEEEEEEELEDIIEDDIEEDGDDELLDDDEEYEDEEMEGCDDDLGSELVHHGTGGGSRKRSSSSE